MTGQAQAVAYVCLGCGSEGLLRNEEAEPTGRARCPRCGRMIVVEAVGQPGDAGPPRLDVGQPGAVPAD